MMMLRQLALLTLIAIGSLAWSQTTPPTTTPTTTSGTLTITSVNGASNYVIPGTTTAADGTVQTGSTFIYGGLAGSCASNDGVNTCNSCENTPACPTAPLCACNTSRIYPGLTLQINLAQTGTTTTTTGVNACIAITPPAGGTQIVPTQLNSRVNGGSFVQLPWSSICAVFGDGTCATITSTTNQASASIWLNSDPGNLDCTTVTSGSSVTFYIKMITPGTSNAYDVFGTPNSNGIGDFVPFPGDEKVYITKTNADGAFPILPYNTKVTAVRVFKSKTSLDDANYTNADTTDLNLASDSSSVDFSRNIVSGLTNNQLYFFRLAMLDEANNVVQFFPNTTATDASGTAHPECTVAGGASASCPFSATPTQVLGLLTKDFNCFIATAAYGSPLEPKLEIFRQFRSQILLRSTWGQAFTKAYYVYGPYAAQYIVDKPILRAFVRAGLWPVYAFSYVALKFGLAYTFAVFAVVLLTLVGLPWWSFRRMNPRA